MTPSIRYLTVDLSEGSDDVHSLEAMASTREAQHDAVMAEVAQMQGWARRVFANRQGPVEEGYAWDDEVLVQQEADGWITVTLTFSASQEFVEAFLAEFGERDD